MIDGLRIFFVYALPWLVMAGSAAMFLRLAAGLHRLNVKLDRGREEFRDELTALRGKVDAVKGEMEPLLEARSLSTHLAGAGIDTAIRAKMLKMHRLGRSVEQIATTLQRPKGEVSMLLKVHAIMMKSFERPTAPPSDDVLEQKA